MYRKVVLICEDVRVDSDGSLTLVGVRGEQVLVPPGSGPIALARMACVVVIGGLRGCARVSFRQAVHREGEPPEPAEPMRVEPHEPTADEHNFVLMSSPMVFPEAGRYVLTLEIEAAGETARYDYPFELARHAGAR